MADGKGQTRQTGVVKYFKSASDGSGYGFIIRDNGGFDVLLKKQDLTASGVSGVTGGQKVSFSIATEKGKDRAVDLVLM